MTDMRAIITIPSNQPLIGIPYQEHGREIVRYFTDDTFSPISESAEDVLTLAGAWSDLSWEDTKRELDRIRHASTPTPPLTV